MLAYPNTENERRVPFDDLRGVVAAIFERCGMSAANAGLLADTLVVADAQGVHSHGVLRVPDYVKKVTRDGVDPRGTPRVVREDAAAVVIDGGNSMGQIGSYAGMTKAIEVARAHALGFAAIRGSNHCGALQYFTRLALPHDMIGIMGTNALPTMAPWGGAEKIVGMNPLSIAIPAGEECPIVFDAAFATTAHGKIRVYAQKGVAIPPGWAFDAAGRPTTDPVKALVGLLQPSGGHKGVALALAMGILSSLLSGAGYGLELGNMEDGPRAGLDGHFCLAIRVSAFVDPAVFKARVDGIVREIHGCRRAPGVDRLYVPGELELETERLHRAEGIPLNDSTLDGVREAARRLGVDASALDVTAAPPARRRALAGR
jgi:LDH2 family malate/lactate/ureidoglycolate dehydrogenase